MKGRAVMALKRVHIPVAAAFTLAIAGAAPTLDQNAGTQKAGTK